MTRERFALHLTDKDQYLEYIYRLISQEDSPVKKWVEDMKEQLTE